MTLSNRKTLFLVGGMLLTGTANTLLNKVQDMQCVDKCDEPNPKDRVYFEQPVFQTLNMFIGEFMCLVTVGLLSLRDRYQSRRYGQGKSPPPLYSPLPRDGSDVSSQDDDTTLAPTTTPALTGWKRCLLWLPTLCDICGTTLMNVGLIYCSASVYQMLRGAVVLFSGIFSVLFLRHHMHLHQWAALVAVMLGVGLVGMSSILAPVPTKQQASTSISPESSAEIEEAAEATLGVFMVLAAQIFTASQFVIEERILSRYRVEALHAVGLEGLFGIISVLTALPFLHLWIGRHHPGGYFDIPEGWDQFTRVPGVWISGVAIAISIAFFNWFGLSVTRTVSATSRSTIDTCRTLFIWMVSLGLGWESLHWGSSTMQVTGFAILIYGTFLFNGVVKPPSFLLSPSSSSEGHPRGQDGETHPILPREVE
ncbi:MAG: hypothetical protein DHS80DRAFT_19093 [Piptocephalis tieghemiana]|nr:MAG: hypothetical protein DHS80DRAFT_19093 [Piptocephalis tieghemiana]